MSDEHGSSKAANPGSYNQWKTIRTLGRYLWPRGRGDLGARVIIALVSLALAKVINIYVPFLYKGVVDALSPDSVLIALPLGLIVAYGGARVLQQLFGELRDLVFARVAAHAQRTIALNTFRHLHALSLGFHLDRQTGGLSRTIERGTNAIDTVLSYSLFSILPTVLEIASLLNYETVKYFGNEDHEFCRFDEALAGYEEASVRSLVTRGEVEFDRVSFGYNGDRVVLRDVSFKVPPGRTVAIVGPSGSGKSTISRLLFRFYDVRSGSIRIDGHDIRGVRQRSLREAIGIVPQDTVLFNDTIGYNILYGRPGVSEAEIHRVAAMAKIHDFVASLSAGYDTLVGERGLKLSGGEKQRVAIARTILKDPRILVFDEATSALDSHTEKEIQASLREVSRDRTALVIAHRLSTIVDADEILVLEEGRIVERGRHAALLARGGRYASIWARQQQAEEYQEKLEMVSES